MATVALLGPTSRLHTKSCDRTTTTRENLIGLQLSNPSKIHAVFVNRCRLKPFGTPIPTFKNVSVSLSAHFLSLHVYLSFLSLESDNFAEHREGAFLARPMEDRSLGRRAPEVAGIL